MACSICHLLRLFKNVLQILIEFAIRFVRDIPLRAIPPAKSTVGLWSPFFFYSRCSAVVSVFLLLRVVPKEHLSASSTISPWCGAMIFKIKKCGKFCRMFLSKYVSKYRSNHDLVRRPAHLYSTLIQQVHSAATFASRELIHETWTKRHELLWHELTTDLLFCHCNCC